MKKKSAPSKPPVAPRGKKKTSSERAGDRRPVRGNRKNYTKAEKKRGSKHAADRRKTRMAQFLKNTGSQGGKITGTGQEATRENRRVDRIQGASLRKGKESQAKGRLPALREKRKRASA